MLRFCVPLCFAGLFAGLVSAAAVPSAPNAEEFCIAGCPAAPAGDTVVVHHLFALSNNPSTRMADWVAYRITPATLGRGCKRIWARDPALPEKETLSPEDYRSAHAALHVDRGHQAPLASLCDSGAPEPHWREDDYLSNITPQKSALNEGPWEKLEAAERTLVSDRVADSVYSLTGPLFERDTGRLPRAPGVRIPSGYWKVVAIRRGDALLAAAFLMDQSMDRRSDFCATQVRLSEIERRAHIALFPRATTAQRRKLGAADRDIVRKLGCRPLSS